MKSLVNQTLSGNRSIHTKTYTQRVPGGTKILFLYFTRTLIIEFADVSIRVQNPVIHRPWNFIHALEKRRRVINFHTQCVIRKLSLIFTGWRHSIASSSRLCCLKPRLRVFRVFIAGWEVWHEQEYSLVRTSSSDIKFVTANSWRFYGVWKGIFASQGYWCIFLLFADEFHSTSVRLPKIKPKFYRFCLKISRVRQMQAPYLQVQKSKRNCTFDLAFINIPVYYKHA